MSRVLEFYKDTIHITQAYQEEAANKRRVPAPKYKVGNKAYLNIRDIKTLQLSKKLDIKFKGSFPITKIINLHAYYLMLLSNSRKYNVFYVL